ncbi:MAG: hypothetical protein PVJ62_05270 [Deltaproteobacteria bacterium]|jgi:hypothetical protein
MAVTDKDKEPIDLLKWRVDKLLEQERREGEGEDARRQLEWSGTKYAREIEGIHLSEHVLKGVKTFMCTIATKVRQAESLREVERLFFGLGLLLLRDHDRVAFDKLLKMMKDEMAEK